MLRRVAFAVVVIAVVIGGSVWMADRANEGSCKSTPFEQLRIGGVNYVGFSKAVATRELGDELGTIEQGLPSASVRCEKWTLEEGMGTPSVGSKVYAVTGREPAVMVAVVDPLFAEPKLFEADTEGLLGS